MDKAVRNNIINCQTSEENIYAQSNKSIKMKNNEHFHTQSAPHIFFLP